MYKCVWYTIREFGLKGVWTIRADIYCALKCSSRCLLIEFQQPPLKMGLSTFIDLAESWKACSSCVGFCIGLGERFFNTGIKDVDNTLTPYIISRAADGVSPRVFPSYASLFWFAKEVIIQSYIGIISCFLHQLCK